jgi:hypothetical protein
MPSHHEQLAPLGAASSPHGRSDRDAVIAGFIVWLAGQRVPMLQRRRAHREAQLFLSWCADQFPVDRARMRAAAWCYLQRLRREERSPAALAGTWAAIELFLSYVDSGLPARGNVHDRL